MSESNSGPNFSRRVPEGDNRQRFVCGDCGWIHYENPRVIVGAVAEWEDHLLLGRRAIPPREGYWNVPAGFLELGERPEDGAAREVLEETGAEIEIRDLLGVYSVPRIGQIHLIYRARARRDRLDPGPETQKAQFFHPDSIPWSELAFPTNRWALEHFLSARGQVPIVPFTAPTN